MGLRADRQLGALEQSPSPVLPGTWLAAIGPAAHSSALRRCGLGRRTPPASVAPVATDLAVYFIDRFVERRFHLGEDLFDRLVYDARA